MIGFVSLVAGIWLAREMFLGERLATVERLRADGGRYVVNEFLTKPYRPEDVSAVIYADSSNESSPTSDRDRRMITEMIDDTLQDRPIASFGVSFPGNAVDWIASHLRYLTYRFPGLDYAVIPLNIRWISPGWRGRRLSNGLRTAYELYASGPLLWVLGTELPYRSPLHRFNPLEGPVDTVIGPLDAAEAALSTSEHLARYGGDPVATARRIEHLRIGVSYGFELATDDPLFALIEHIAKLCAETKVRCLFYLPPFNLGYAEESAPAVAQALRDNLRQVRRFARARNLVLLDLSETLTAVHFHDRVNEHVDETGRRLIAGCLTQALTIWHEAGDIGPGPLSCTPSGTGDFAVTAGQAEDPQGLRQPTQVRPQQREPVP